MRRNLHIMSAALLAAGAFGLAEAPLRPREREAPEPRYEPVQARDRRGKKIPRTPGDFARLEAAAAKRARRALKLAARP